MHDRQQDGFPQLILQHFGRPEAKGSDPTFCQPLIAALVVSGLDWTVMTHSVDLDG